MIKIKVPKRQREEIPFSDKATLQEAWLDFMQAQLQRGLALMGETRSPSEIRAEDKGSILDIALSPIPDMMRVAKERNRVLDELLLDVLGSNAKVAQYAARVAKLRLEYVHARPMRVSDMFNVYAIAASELYPRQEIRQRALVEAVRLSKEDNWEEE